MRPCIGIVGVQPPFCTLKETRDGTYSLADMLRFNLILDDIEAETKKAMRNLDNGS